MAARSIDRLCLYNYSRCLSEEGPESLVCFSCARRFPYVPSWCRNEVRWITPLSAAVPATAEHGSSDAAAERLFCGLGRAKVEDFFGFHTYLKRYGRCAGESPDLTLPEPMKESEDWKLRVEFAGNPLDILCCPEDRDCINAACARSRSPRCCAMCRLPLCSNNSFVETKGAEKYPLVTVAPTSS